MSEEKKPDEVDDPKSEVATSTIKTQTVEEVDAAYAGSPEEQKDPEVSAENGASTDEALSTEDAPAFQEPAVEVSQEKITLPVDPDGSKMLLMTRNCLRTLIPAEQDGAIFDLLKQVAENDAMVRAVSIVLARVLGHEGAHEVTLKLLYDVMQGNEGEHFAKHGLAEDSLLAVFQRMTPEMIRQLSH